MDDSRRFMTLRATEFAGLAGAAAVSLAVAMGGGFDPDQRVVLGLLMAAVSAVLWIGLAFRPRVEESLALAVIGWAAVSAVLSTTYPLAAKEMVGGWLVAWVIWVGARRVDTNRWPLMGLAIAAAVMVVTLAVVLESVAGRMLRTGGLFVNPNVAAAFLVPAVPALWLLFGAPRLRRVAWLVLPIMMAGIVCTGSRAGLLAGVVVVGVLLPGGWTRRIGVAAALLAASGFLIWRFTSSPDSLAWHRIEIWRALAELVAHHPLAGVGPGWLEESTGVVRIAHDGGIARYGHVIGSAESTYFGLLVRTGIVGFGLAVAALVVWIRRSPSLKLVGASRAIVAGIGVLALFHDVLDVDVVLWWWAALLGAAAPLEPVTLETDRTESGWTVPLKVAAGLAMAFMVSWSVAQPAWARSLWWNHSPTEELAVKALRADPWLSEPGQWVVRNRLAALEWTWETVAEVRDWSRQTVTIHPGSALVWSEDAKVSARVVNDFGQWPDAVEGARGGFGRATTLEPHVPWYWLQWAAFERSVGRVDEAQRLAERAVGEEPNFVRGWLFLARLDLDAGDPDRARAAYQRASTAAELARTKVLTPYERDLLWAPEWQVEEVAAGLAGGIPAGVAP